ncbi:MAG: AAA family ATPase [Pseudomonadota bacterium]
MRPTERILITGASGSGKSTLGRALASARAAQFFDSDDFYWQPTNPPFEVKRDREDRVRLMRDVFVGFPKWVLSGSIMTWGEALLPELDLIVFLSAPTDLRLARLKARELQLRGIEAIGPGGPDHEAHLEFIAWAAAYEGPAGDVLTRTRHEVWLRTVPCPVLRLNGDQPLDALVTEIASALDDAS